MSSRSQSAKQYSAPSHRSYYNPSVWMAEGYFVFQPDILFDARDPGISSARTLEKAVAAVVARGEVDGDRVGLVGHSWGGYQAQFVPTYTDIFAASVSGAGISNLVTMYGSMFWVAGAPEMEHAEVGQERMEVPYYVDLEAYIRNSAVFNIESLNTPLLMEVGDADRNVDWRQSIELYNLARRAKKTGHHAGLLWGRPRPAEGRESGRLSEPDSRLVRASPAGRRSTALDH